MIYINIRKQFLHTRNIVWHYGYPSMIAIINSDNREVATQKLHYFRVTIIRNSNHHTIHSPVNRMLEIGHFIFSGLWVGQKSDIIPTVFCRIPKIFQNLRKIIVCQSAARFLLIQNPEIIRAICLSSDEIFKIESSIKFNAYGPSIIPVIM